MSPSYRLPAIVGVLTLLAASCGPAAATPSPTATGVPRTAATATPQPTSTPAPIATTVPSPTPLATAAPTQARAVAPKYGGILRVRRAMEDPSWDVMKFGGGGGDVRPMGNMVFSMLASPAGMPAKPCQVGLNPELAESWRWADDSTFEVKIRQGVKFHAKPPVNGRELTAEDVAYSYKRGFFVTPARGIKVVADQVKDIVAKDRYTVQFQTKGPLAIILDTLAWRHGLIVLAKESGGAKESWENPGETWIGSGPFMFDRHYQGLKTVMLRNPDYFEKGFPYVDRIEHILMPDKSTTEAAMRSGKMDIWDYDVLALNVLSLQKTSPDLRVQECMEPVGRGAGWTHFRWGDPVWQDVRVRRAAMMAVDRQRIVDVAMLGKGALIYPYPTTASTLFTKKEDLSPEAQKYLTYNPEEAKRLLREAGYPEGKGPRITIGVGLIAGTVGPYPTGTEIVGKMLEAAGFQVKIEWYDAARWAAGPSPGIWPEGWDAAVHYASAYYSSILTNFHSKADPAANKAGVRDPEMDKLIDQWVVTLDPNKSWELAKAIQNRIVEQAYGIPGATGYEFALSQPWVKGYSYIQNPYSRAIAYVWLDK